MQKITTSLFIMLSLAQKYLQMEENKLNYENLAATRMNDKDTLQKSSKYFTN